MPAYTQTGSPVHLAPSSLSQGYNVKTTIDLCNSMPSQS